MLAPVAVKLVPPIIPLMLPQLADPVATQVGTAGSALEREMAAVLRRIEQGARNTRTQLEGGETAYLGLIRRLMQQSAAAGPRDEPRSPSLILP